MRAVARALVARTKSNVEPIYKKQPRLVFGGFALIAGVIWLAGQSAGGGAGDEAARASSGRSPRRGRRRRRKPLVVVVMATRAMRRRASG